MHPSSDSSSSISRRIGRAQGIFLLHRVCFLRMGGTRRRGISSSVRPRSDALSVVTPLAKAGKARKISLLCLSLDSLYRWTKWGDDTMLPTQLGEAHRSKLSFRDEPQLTPVVLLAAVVALTASVISSALPDVLILFRNDASIWVRSPSRVGEQKTLTAGGILGGGKLDFFWPVRMTTRID
eukprot:CAMPEP_0178709798 /NCGR_PEP_ID=MMETSP0699-20121125/17426_1 /TAXON_ID=265572 /ORGANISM="Extubocellulus spinifer, Strain CCMP396" /LENGTH=180 /DNA_ID=CAMNT_0020358277 /DNA_START=254 /DNA_END=796 /DNA_ORIENTATION=+